MTIEKVLWRLSIVFLIVTFVSFLGYRSIGVHWLKSVYITFLTTSYHFLMRLCLDKALTYFLYCASLNPNHWYFKQFQWETTFYHWLKVKQWKGKALTARPNEFKTDNLKELLQVMLRAELGHRIIIILSFLPLLLILTYGNAQIFIITSTVSALFDFQFVIIQRYNRPRVIRLIERQEQRVFKLI